MRAVVQIVLLTSLAAAQPPTAEDKARSAYEEGRTAFEAERFEAALGHFERAYLLDNAPPLLFNMARACEEMGRAAKAVYYYELYLDRLPEASDRVDVERRIARMKALLAAETAAAVTVEPATGPEPTSLRPWAYVTLGAGAVALGVGGYQGARAAQHEDDHRSADDPADAAQARDDGESAVTAANVAYAVGGALLATGAALFVLEPDARTTVALTPGGAVWSIRW